MLIVESFYIPVIPLLHDGGFTHDMIACEGTVDGAVSVSQSLRFRVPKPVNLCG